MHFLSYIVRVFIVNIIVQGMSQKVEYDVDPILNEIVTEIVIAIVTIKGDIQMNEITLEINDVMKKEKKKVGRMLIITNGGNLHHTRIIKEEVILI